MVIGVRGTMPTARSTPPADSHAAGHRESPRRGSRRRPTRRPREVAGQPPIVCSSSTDGSSHATVPTACIGQIASANHARRRPDEHLPHVHHSGTSSTRKSARLSESLEPCVGSSCRSWRIRGQRSGNARTVRPSCDAVAQFLILAIDRASRVVVDDRDRSRTRSSRSACDCPATRRIRVARLRHDRGVHERSRRCHALVRGRHLRQWAAQPFETPSGDRAGGAHGARSVRS